MKGLAFICGIGLLVLWLFGLGSPAATGWLTWLDGIGGVLGLIVAAGVKSELPRSSDVVGSGILSLGLFALWIIGMATHAMPWQNWWTFVFACGMAIVAISLGGQRKKGHPVISESQEEQDRAKLRKVG